MSDVTPHPVQSEQSTNKDYPCGEGEGAEPLDALDMNVAGDRTLLAEAIRRGWQINPVRKRHYFQQLDKVVNTLDLIEDPAKRAQVATQAARVLVAEQAQALRDVHHIERMQHESGILDLRMRRADEGKPSDIVEVRVTPVRELPLPEYLAGHRRRILEPAGPS